MKRVNRAILSQFPQIQYQDQPCSDCGDHIWHLIFKGRVTVEDRHMLKLTGSYSSRIRWKVKYSCKCGVGWYTQYL